MISISNKVSAACKVLWLTQFITVGPSCHLSHYPQWWSPRVCKEIDLMASFGLVILRPFNSATGRGVERQFQLNDLQNQTTWDEHHHPGNMAGTNQIWVFSPHSWNSSRTKLSANVDCCIIQSSAYVLWMKPFSMLDCWTDRVKKATQPKPWWWFLSFPLYHTASAFLHVCPFTHNCFSKYNMSLAVAYSCLLFSDWYDHTSILKAKR